MPRNEIMVDQTYLKKLGLPYEIGKIDKRGKNYFFISGRKRKLIPETFVPNLHLTGLTNKIVAQVSSKDSKSVIAFFPYVEKAIKWFPIITCYIPAPDIFKRMDKMVRVAIVKELVAQNVLEAPLGREIEDRINERVF